MLPNRLFSKKRKEKKEREVRQSTGWLNKTNSLSN